MVGAGAGKRGRGRKRVKIITLSRIYGETKNETCRFVRHWQEAESATWGKAGRARQV